MKDNVKHELAQLRSILLEHEAGRQVGKTLPHGNDFLEHNKSYWGAIKPSDGI